MVNRTRFRGVRRGIGVAAALLLTAAPAPAFLLEGLAGQQDPAAPTIVPDDHKEIPPGGPPVPPTPTPGQSTTPVTTPTEGPHATPEPASVVAGLIGLAVVGATRRRRK